MTNIYSFNIDNNETFSEQQIEEISQSISAAVETVILEQYKSLSDSLNKKKKLKKSSKIEVSNI